LFSGWSDEVPSASRQITVTQFATSYTAEFETQYQLTLTANPANGGTVSASDMHADSFYPKGAIETLTATPNAAATRILINAASIAGVATNTTVPVPVPDIQPNSSQLITLVFPPINATGNASSLTLGGTYSGDSINYASRIVLP
jgi:hypothetical protein